MKEYLKIVIVVTILTFVSIMLVAIVLGQQLYTFNAALAAVLNGFALGFVLKKL